jgi:hypothetical protein
LLIDKHFHLGPCGRVGGQPPFRRLSPAVHRDAGSSNDLGTPPAQRVSAARHPAAQPPLLGLPPLAWFASAGPRANLALRDSLHKCALRHSLVIGCGRAGVVSQLRSTGLRRCGYCGLPPLFLHKDHDQ